MHFPPCVVLIETRSLGHVDFITIQINIIRGPYSPFKWLPSRSIAARAAPCLVASRSPST